MEMEELVKKFDEVNKDGGMLRKAFCMLADVNPSKASEFLDCYNGVHTYYNYLSESEAKNIVKGFIHYDKSTGHKWSPDTMFEKVESLKGKIEEKPFYNKWALYATMNMEHSDHGNIINKWADGDSDKYAEICYELAVSQLTDVDRKEFVRSYFNIG